MSFVFTEMDSYSPLEALSASSGSDLDILPPENTVAVSGEGQPSEDNSLASGNTDAVVAAASVFRVTGHISWLCPLYVFDNRDVLRMCDVGYSSGVCHTRTGIVYTKNGKPGKVTERQRNIPANHRSKTALAAAKEYAEQTWREKQQVHRYRPSDACPKQSDLLQWRESDNRRWPAVCKKWEDCKPDQIACSIERPWLGQAKVNGDRCMAWLKDGSEAEVRLISRSCLEMKFKAEIRRQCAVVLTHIKKYHSSLWPCGLDGELYAPSMKHHQQSRSAVARTVNEHVDEAELAFVCFDLMEYSLPFNERAQKMREIWGEIGAPEVPSLILLDTKELTSDGDVAEYFEHCKSIGYDEGIVVRRSHLLYSKKHEHKHYEMLKKKRVYDAEYTVIGYKEGESDRKGCVVWRCQDPGNPKVFFNCDQVGTLESQRMLYDTAEKYIGRLLTVEYSEFSADGVPKFPHGIRFREVHDLPVRRQRAASVSSEDDD